MPKAESAPSVEVEDQKAAEGEWLQGGMHQATGTENEAIPCVFNGR
jgi:hypothetical protein